jgi:hypothetical protein
MKEVKMKGEYFILLGVALILFGQVITGALDYATGTTPQTYNYGEAMEQNSVITVYGYDVENNVKEFAIYTTNPEQIKIYDFEDILEVEGTYIYSFVNQKRATIDVRTDK